MARPATFPNTDFTYDAKTRVFASEASDLGGRFTGGSFYIQSVKTKATRLFLLDRAEHDAEGDLVAWHFFVPGGELRAVVFND